MIKVIAAILVMTLGAALTLAAVTLLVTAAIRISLIANPALRALATVGELITGVAWLLGTVYLSTHLAVRIFGRPPRP